MNKLERPIALSSDVQGTNANGEVLRSMFIQHEPVDVYFAQIGEKGYDGKTRQEFAAECDINNLLAAYERDGTVPMVNPIAGQYLDVTDVPDLQSALDIVDRAQAAFMTLSAKVRREFDDDPVKFVQFAQDPENLEQMRTWGLAPPPEPEPKPQKVEVVNPPSAPGSAPSSSAGS